LPLPHPLDQVLTLSILSRHNGLMCHALGVSYQGKGLLFLGRSGSGKSTLAELLKPHPDFRLLSDDRIIIRSDASVGASRIGASGRRSGKRFWIYGTPWSGTAHVASPEGVLLKTIYLLCHPPSAERNQITTPTGSSTARLLSNCFTPAWERAGLQNYLDLCADLVNHISVKEFSFKPDQTVVEFIRNAQKN